MHSTAHTPVLGIHIDAVLDRKLDDLVVLVRHGHMQHRPPIVVRARDALHTTARIAHAIQSYAREALWRHCSNAACAVLSQPAALTAHVR